MRMLIVLLGLLCVASAQTAGGVAGEAKTAAGDVVPRAQVRAEQYAKKEHGWDAERERERKREQVRKIKEAEKTVSRQANVLEKAQKAAEKEMETLKAHQEHLAKLRREQKAEQDQEKANMATLLQGQEDKAKEEIATAKAKAKKEEKAVQEKEAKAAEKVLEQANKDKDAEKLEEKKLEIAKAKEKKVEEEKKEAQKKADEAQKKAQKESEEAIKKAQEEKVKEENAMKQQLEDQRKIQEKRQADAINALNTQMDGLKSQIANLNNQAKVDREACQTTIDNTGADYETRMKGVRAAADVEVKKAEQGISLAKDQCAKEKKEQSDKAAADLAKLNAELMKSHDANQKAVDENAKAIGDLEKQCNDKINLFTKRAKTDADANSKKAEADCRSRIQISTATYTNQINSLTKAAKDKTIADDKARKVEQNRMKKKVDEINKLMDSVSGKETTIRNLKDQLSALSTSMAGTAASAATDADENDGEVASSLNGNSGLVYSLVALNILLTGFCAKFHLDSKRNNNTYQATLLEEEF